MEEIPAAGRECTCSRYITVLSQRIAATGYAPWTRFLKPAVPHRLFHLPHSPVLRSGPVVDLDLQGSVSCMRSETIDLDAKPEVEFSSSLISLSPNPDHKSGSTVPPDPEQTMPGCSETVNTEEILRCLRRHPIFKRSVLPKPFHRSALGFEALSSTSTHRALRCRLCKPVHKSACIVPLGFENFPSTTTEIAHSDAVSEPEFDSSLTPLPLRQMHVSGSPIAPEFEQHSSSGSETNDSDSVTEPQLIRDAILLVRTAVLASVTEIQQSLEQLIFTRCSSESSESDGTRDFIGAGFKADIVRLPCTAVFASGTQLGPDHERITSGSEVASDVEQTVISISYWDNTDSDRSDPEKRSFKCEVKGSAASAAISSTRVRAGVLVAEGPNTAGTGGNDSGAALRTPTSEGAALRKLNPNAEEFVPRAWTSGNFLALSGRESNCLQKVELVGADSTLSSAEAKAPGSPVSAPGHSPLDLGTALRMKHETRGWVKWSHENKFAPDSDADIIWGSGQGKAINEAITGKSGPVENLKLLSRKNKKAIRRRRQRNIKRQAGHHPWYPAPRARRRRCQRYINRQAGHHPWYPTPRATPQVWIPKASHDKFNT